MLLCFCTCWGGKIRDGLDFLCVFTDPIAVDKEATKVSLVLIDRIFSFLLRRSSRYTITEKQREGGGYYWPKMKLESITISSMYTTAKARQSPRRLIMTPWNVIWELQVPKCMTQTCKLPNVVWNAVRGSCPGLMRI